MRMMIARQHVYILGRLENLVGLKMKSSVLLELCLVIPCVRLIVINQTVVQYVGYYALVVK
jgi:hypothetical protein